MRGCRRDDTMTTMTTLRFCFDGSGNGTGWEGASGCSCTISLVFDEDNTVRVLFTLALHLPEETPVSSKIGEWLGLLIGLWEMERWLDNDENARKELITDVDGDKERLAHFIFPQQLQENRTSMLSSQSVEVVGDNQSLINILQNNRDLQCIHVWEQPAVEAARTVLAKLSGRSTSSKAMETIFRWVPREQNEECDALAKRAKNEPGLRNVSAETYQKAMALIREEVIPRRNEWKNEKEARLKNKEARRKNKRRKL